MDQARTIKLLARQPRLSGYSPQHSGALFLSLLLVAGSLSGCGKELIKSIGDLARLREDLIKEFHEDDVSVVVQNSNLLVVTFINSALNDQSNLKRMERAQATADFVRGHYPSIGRIERLWVAFAASETRFLVLHFNRGIDRFLFDKKGTMVGPPAEYAAHPESADDEAATANYNQSRNETNVQIARLQLAGDLNDGIALVPHFTIPGNATAADHVKALPRTVNFSFACYSSKKIFNGDPQLLIIADGKPVYSGTARNLSTQTAGGNEFLDQEIPFPQFLEMTRAEKVTLRLAAREYPFTDGQLSSLREMASYATSKRR
jgi:hypothetical protein